jgi:hypothetical protein
VEITIESKLTGNLENHQRIAATVGSVLKMDPCPAARGDGFTLEASSFDLSELRDFARPGISVSGDALKKFVEHKIGMPNQHAFAYARSNRCAIVVVVKSRRPDRVAEGIYRQLKSAAGQFSQTRTAVIAVQLTDVTPRQLRDIARLEPQHDKHSNSLQQLSTRLMANPGRGFIHTIAFGTRGNIRIARESAPGRPTTTYSDVSPAYYFTNDAHPLYDDARCNLFSNVE